jgi:hypothetical protein
MTRIDLDIEVNTNTPSAIEGTTNYLFHLSMRWKPDNEDQELEPSGIRIKIQHSPPDASNTSNNCTIDTTLLTNESLKNWLTLDITKVSHPDCTSGDFYSRLDYDLNSPYDKILYISDRTQGQFKLTRKYIGQIIDGLFDYDTNERAIITQYKSTITQHLKTSKVVVKPHRNTEESRIAKVRNKTWTDSMTHWNDESLLDDLYISSLFSGSFNKHK